MPASDSTEALRHALAKVFCAIGVSGRLHRDAGARNCRTEAGSSSNGVGNLSLTINNNPPPQFDAHRHTRRSGSAKNSRPAKVEPRIIRRTGWTSADSFLANRHSVVWR